MNSLDLHIALQLTRFCSAIDAAKDRQGPACVNSAPKGAVKLTQQSPPALFLAGPKPGINALIDARIDAPTPPATPQGGGW